MSNEHRIKLQVKSQNIKKFEAYSKTIGGEFFLKIHTT